MLTGRLCGWGGHSMACTIRSLADHAWPRHGVAFDTFLHAIKQVIGATCGMLHDLWCFQLQSASHAKLGRSALGCMCRCDGLLPQTMLPAWHVLLGCHNRMAQNWPSSAPRFRKYPLCMRLFIDCYPHTNTAMCMALLSRHTTH